METMKRHECWRHNYRQQRDLDHLSPEELSERLHDCINNIRVRTEQGKLGLLDIREPHGETWMILSTEIMEECSLRNYSYPGPISIAKYRSSLENAFDPIPNVKSVFDSYQLRSRPYLIKFGEEKWLRQSLEQGKLRIASASYYDKDEHNHARRDTELQRFFRLNSKNPHYPGKGINGGWSNVTSSTDYLLFCLSATYSSRLFGDFGANACLIIFAPDIFFAKLLGAVKRQLPHWSINLATVTYYDPVRVAPSTIVVQNFKPFRHAYQNEIRIICIPPESTPTLQPIEIEMGSLRDCATLVYC